MRSALGRANPKTWLAKTPAGPPSSPVPASQRDSERHRGSVLFSLPGCHPSFLRIAVLPAKKTKQTNKPQQITQRRQQPRGAFRTISVETFRPSPMPKPRRDGRTGELPRGSPGGRRGRIRVPASPGSLLLHFQVPFGEPASRSRRRHRAEITLCLLSPSFLAHWHRSAGSR